LALSQVGWCEGQEAPVEPEVIRRVGKIIQRTLSKELEERQEAWKQLKDMGNLAVPGLSALYDDRETTPEMKQSILLALGDSQDARAGPALVEILGKPDPAQQIGACRALERCGYKPAVPALQALLARPSAELEEDLRLFAARAAVKLGGLASAQDLIALLTSGNPQIRARAAFALGDALHVHGKPNAESPPELAEWRKKAGAALRGLIRDEHRGVREDAVEALRVLGDGQGLQGLVAYLGDTDYKIRSAAMAYLEELSGESQDNEAAWTTWWNEKGRKKYPEAQE
jgi:hypothetical protein